MSVNKVKLNELKEFDENEIRSVRTLGKIEGIFAARRILTATNGTPIKSKAFGTDLEVIDLTDSKGEVKTYWCDAGMRGALKLGKVEAGMHLEIIHTGEKKLDDSGFKVQTYDVMQLVTA